MYGTVVNIRCLAAERYAGTHAEVEKLQKQLATALSGQGRSSFGRRAGEIISSNVIREVLLRHMEAVSVSGDADDGVGGAAARSGVPPAKVAPKRPRAGAALNPRGRGCVLVPLLFLLLLCTLTI